MDSFDLSMNLGSLYELRCITVLAEELSFRRAAERFAMSQPPLTRLVSEPEQALGVKLFERTTRRVSLTPTGEVYVSEARAVLMRAEEAFATLEAARRQQQKRLRVAYTPPALALILPQILGAFRTQHHDLPD